MIVRTLCPLQLRSSSAERTKQHKVVNRAEKMIAYFKELGLDKLKELENAKRSKTDNFAYHVALTELEKTNEN